jgi:hypothetical protein
MSRKGQRAWSGARWTGFESLLPDESREPTRLGQRRVFRVSIPGPGLTHFAAVAQLERASG